jgi:hypothetical protein
MRDYGRKSYGRNDEVSAIYQLFEAGRDVKMPGPRRLGKSFLLERLVDAAPGRGWTAVKVEVAGDDNPRAFFRQLCGAIGTKRSGGQNAIAWFRQRLGQVIDPRSDTAGPWYQPLIALDHEGHFERLIKAMHDDQVRRWALLIDELPIFLKAMHDKGEDGIDAARNFMNLTSRLRAKYPRVRWMITGSIGLEPLARVGNYTGVLVKLDTFQLEPLSEAQACDFVRDLALDGALLHRKAITDAEAVALVNAVGWRAAHYLDALARQLQGEPTENIEQANALVERAVLRLLDPRETPTFSVWEEHLRKHYQPSERTAAHAVLSLLAPHPQGLSLDVLLAGVDQQALGRAQMRELLIRLDMEGFVTVQDWDDEDTMTSFRNPLLRRWWQRFKPQPTL